MSEPFLGEIRIVGFGFPPRGWALCDGQLLQISQNSALFSLLGTTYGGDGRTTFGLPDLRGRMPVHVGSGPGLNPVSWGQKSGSNNASLAVTNLPPHGHTVEMPCNSEEGNTDDPDGKFPAVNAEDQYSNTGNERMGTFNSGNVGSSTPFSIQNPFLGLYFVIATQGIYPSRS